MLKLLKVNGFIAFISVAFINAFVDLGHKIIIQNTLFKSYDGAEQVILTSIVNGLVLLPFVLLFSPAGFISDRFKKPLVMRWSARLAVLVTLIITLSYYQGWFYLGFAMTFVLALQSALYSPAKYGYIRDLLGSDHLSEGNGWVQAVSMIAILSGIVVFSFLFEQYLSSAIAVDMTPNTILTMVAPLGWLLVIGSIIEAVLAEKMPDTNAGDANKQFDWAAYKTGKLTQKNLSMIWAKKPILKSISGIAMFWTICQIILAVFPSYAETMMGETNTFVIQSIMALAGIGIMSGSALAGILSRNHINMTLIPVGAIGFAIGLSLLAQVDSLSSSALIFFCIGLFGSLMVVPLSALVQFYAEEENQGQILSGSNFLQNLAMLGGLALTVIFSLAALDEKWLLGFTAIAGITGALITIKALPQAMVRGVLSLVFRGRYRINIQGIKHIPAEGKGALLLGNHISWIDWAIIQIASPRRVRFVMDKTIYQRWYLTWFLDMFNVIPISIKQSRHALKQVRSHLDAGDVVCLFPEGMISHTGQLSEFKKGFERTVEGTSAVIIPFYLHGLWGSRFSRSASTHCEPHKLFGLKRDLIIAFGKPLPNTTKAPEVKQKVFELSINTWQEYSQTLPTIADAFIHTAKSAPQQWAITNGDQDPISYRKLLTGATIFSRFFKRYKGERLGLLLPTTTVGSISNIAALMAGKTVVNINYTASKEAILSSIKQAEIKTIVTAKQFIKKLEDKGINTGEVLDSVDVIYLEDIAKQITPINRIGTFIFTSILPAFILTRLINRRRNLDDTAAILFSSGSEGTPKGIELTHQNIMANCKQVANMLNLRDNDVIMATLPLFHAFGLTVTCFMPLVRGIPTVCSPDPTDGLAIGKAVYRFQASLLFGTATFYRLYCRNQKLEPSMFSSLRYVIAGAEKLNDATREAFKERFNKSILEGYGCTETSPVASVNIPDHISDHWTKQIGHKVGTVGLALPGTKFRIVDPDSLEELDHGEEGLILIGGPQIMKGYLNNSAKTAEAILEENNVRWYKTGDKGKLDKDGFLSIVDRYSRFAKLGGEMVSLGDIEQRVRVALTDPELPLVAINLPDAKKGEKVILMLEGEHDTKAVRQDLINAGMPSLLLPNKILSVDKVPVLGSGKTDFANSKKLAADLT
jgi:acyl-[acyl-carrier-protein]-phospholipid O-acyltransferase/long-chain-fatty-acid--[acyl-carrier-protein] ligase